MAMTENNDPSAPQCPFHPPKPKHRKHSLGHLKRLLTREKFDMLGSYTERAYSYLMGKNNMGISTVYAVNCLDSAEKIMMGRYDEYPKSTVLFRALEPLIGDSLLTLNGDKWKKQRKLMAPAFSHLNVKAGYRQMQIATDNMLKSLEEAASTGEVINLDHVMTLVTADIIFRVMFSRHIDGAKGTKVYENFQIFHKEQKYFSIKTLINWPKWVPYFGKRQNKKALKAAKTIRNILSLLIEERIAIPTEKRPKDMLSAILAEFKAEYGDDLPVVQLVDHVASFFMAGHETTASATTWAAYLLACSPGDEEKMVENVQAVCGDEPVGYADLRKLTHVDAVLKEGMRLYAPVPYYPRVITQDMTLRSHHMKKGSQCTVNSYFIHRNTRWWDDPDVFIPDRFLTQGGTPDHKMAFIPFGAGPRKCPGENFAMVEATLIIASLFRAYHIEIVDPMSVVPLGQITLKPEGGILARVAKRSKAS